MSTVGLLCLVAAFFFTAGISVVTGGTSVITVPVMLSFGSTLVWLWPIRHDY